MKTYTWELVAAVTALGGGSALLDVQDTQLTTGRLDDARPVGGGVVASGKNFLSVLRVLSLSRAWLRPLQPEIRTRREFSPVTASVGNTVSRHFGGLTWIGRVKRLAGRDVGRLRED